VGARKRGGEKAKRQLELFESVEDGLSYAPGQRSSSGRLSTKRLSSHIWLDGLDLMRGIGEERSSGESWAPRERVFVVLLKSMAGSLKRYEGCESEMRSMKEGKREIPLSPPLRSLLMLVLF
jgi:hypothetical protein